MEQSLIREQFKSTFITNLFYFLDLLFGLEKCGKMPLHFSKAKICKVAYFSEIWKTLLIPERNCDSLQSLWSRIISHKNVKYYLKYLHFT